MPALMACSLFGRHLCQHGADSVLSCSLELKQDGGTACGTGYHQGKPQCRRAGAPNNVQFSPCSSFAALSRRVKALCLWLLQAQLGFFLPGCLGAGDHSRQLFSVLPLKLCWQTERWLLLDGVNPCPVTDPSPHALWCPPVAPPGAGYGGAVQLQLPARGCSVDLLLPWLHSGGFGDTVHAGLCPESRVCTASVLRAPAAMQQPVGLNRTWWFSVLRESPCDATWLLLNGSGTSLLCMFLLLLSYSLNRLPGRFC